MKKYGDLGLILTIFALVLAGGLLASDRVDNGMISLSGVIEWLSRF